MEPGHEFELGLIELEDEDLDLAERPQRDDEGDGDGDWYAVRTDPWPCPNPECAVVMPYITAMHHVIVVSDRDRLLDACALAAQHGRNPRIIAYDDVFPTMTLDSWISRGRPVHGIRQG